MAERSYVRLREPLTILVGGGVCGWNCSRTSRGASIQFYGNSYLAQMYVKSVEAVCDACGL